MAIVEFPPLEASTPEGLLALGGDLEIPSLLLAYSQGIFPWPISPEYPLAWFSPDPRGMLFYSQLHISKALKKFLAKNIFHIKIDHNFKLVIQKCASSIRNDSTSGTWITPELMEAYTNLHDAGFAHSIEAYDKDNNLAGGLYGVFLRGSFSGESMFYEQDNASKACLIWVMDFLNTHGIPWMDTQMVSPVVRALGGQEVQRKEFIHLLNQAQKNWITEDPFQKFRSNTLPK